MNRSEHIRYDSDYIEKNAFRWKRFLHRYFRAQIFGMQHCPSTPFVAVGNHSGAILIPDTLVWLSFYHSFLQQQKPKHQRCCQTALVLTVVFKIEQDGTIVLTIQLARFVTDRHGLLGRAFRV